LVTGAAQDPGAESIVVGLTRDIARLATGQSLSIAEFSPAGVAVWKVRPDATGTPRVVRYLHDFYALRNRSLLDQAERLDQTELLDRIRTDGDGTFILARTGPNPRSEADRDALDANQAFELARAAYPGSRAFRSATAVDDLLAEATARVPLPASLWYELVLLRRSRSGRLEFTAQQLFLPEARRGDTRQFAVRCEPGDDNGTVFAVAARDAVFEFQLVSMASAKVPPGTYYLTATLLRPGLVRFDGLPVKLRQETRSWAEVLARVPERLDAYGPCHLIVAVEACGTADEFEARIDRADQLIADVQDAADGPVTFSLLTYAAHTHRRQAGEEAVNVVAWAETDPGTLTRLLRALAAGGPSPARYPRAAQVECMLAEVARRLAGPAAAAAGRPALVTIGSRPAFPHRVDRVTEILPCPERHDWRSILRGLADDHAGMAFGAIRDTPDGLDDRPAGPLNEVWRHLGTDMSAAPGDYEAHAFAAGLGLVPPVLQYLPFPLAIPEGAD
jgi:hypothetical protein